MTKAYHPELRGLIMSSAEEANIEISEGVYAGVLGPTYETFR